MTVQRVQRRPRGAFVLHDARINFDNLEANTAADDTSDYTQAGARPGVAERGVPDGTYLPCANVAQPNDLDIYLVRSGLPEADTGAGVVYREDGEASTSYRGWNEPNLLLGLEPVEWDSTYDWEQADIVTCPRSQKAIALASESTATRDASAWVWDPATRTWGARTAIASGRLVCGCVLRATGRVLAFVVETAGGGAKIYSSDDDGSTWDEYAPQSMRPSGTISIDSNVTEIRMIEDRNGHLLLIAMDSGDWWQFVSRDQGVHWEAVADGTWSVGGSLQIAKLSNETIVVARNLFAATYNLVQRQIATAYDSVGDATELTISSTRDFDTCALAVDPGDGLPYVFSARRYDSGVEDSGDRIDVISGDISATSWTIYSDSVIQHGPATPGDAVNDRKRLIAATFSGGQVIALIRTQYRLTDPASDGSLISIILGGWSSIEHAETTYLRTNRFAWGDSGADDRCAAFLPLDTFENQGWTETGTAETIVSGMHRFNTSAATSYDTLDLAVNASGGYVILLEVKVVTGGALGTDDCAFIHRRRDGSVARILRIRFATTGFRIRDGAGAGSTIGDVTVDLTAKTQILIYYDTNSLVTVFYRAPSSDIWLLGATGTLTTEVSAATTDQFQIGNLASTTSDFRVGLLCFMAKTNGMLRGIANDATTGMPRMSWGRSLTTYLTPVRDQIDADGNMLALSARGGVGALGETFDLPAQYDYGVANLDPVRHPSPRRSWRSTSTASEIVIVWDLGSDTRLGSSWLPALSLARTNLQRCYLEVSTNAASTTWIELGLYDSRVVQSGSFVREGNLLYPDTGNTVLGRRFIGDDEAARGFVVMDPSGTPVARRIKSNTGGNWGGLGPQATFDLEGQEVTDPTSGTVHVFLQSGILVCSSVANELTYRRVRLRIPVQDVVDDYYEIGSIVLGAVHALGRQNSRGWSWRHVPLISETEDTEGVEYYEPRIDSPDRPYRRELTIAWQDAARDGSLERSPRAVGPRGSDLVLAAEHDVFRQLLGLLRRSRGGQLPASALLEVPDVTTTITDPLVGGIVGRLSGVAQRNNVQGDAGRNEITRTESITWREIP